MGSALQSSPGVNGPGGISPGGSPGPGDNAGNGQGGQRTPTSSPSSSPTVSPSSIPTIKAVAVDDAVVTDTLTPVTINILDNDSGGTLSITDVNFMYTGYGSVMISGSSVAYDPRTGTAFSEPVTTLTIPYSIINGDGDTATASITITVNNASGDSPNSVPANGAASGPTQDADFSSIAVVTGPTSDPTISPTSEPTNPPTDSPTATPEVVAVADTAITNSLVSTQIPVLNNDSGGPLTITNVELTETGKGVVTFSDNTIFYDPTTGNFPDLSTTLTFTYTAMNKGGKSGSATVTMTVTRDPVCGDGVIEGGESCDDNNLVDGDGCSSACTIEQVMAVNDAGSTDALIAVELNVVLNDLNGANEIVSFVPPDRGVVTSVSETTLLFDASADPHQFKLGTDSVTFSYTVKNAYNTTATATVTVTTSREAVCGDFVIEEDGGEDCEDGNTDPDDGCSDACVMENPVASEDQVEVDAFTVVEIPVLDNDYGGQQLSIVTVTEPTLGQISYDDNVIEYNPQPDAYQFPIEQLTEVKFTYIIKNEYEKQSEETTVTVLVSRDSICGDAWEDVSLKCLVDVNICDQLSLAVVISHI